MPHILTAETSIFAILPPWKRQKTRSLKWPLTVAMGEMGTARPATSQIFLGEGEAPLGGVLRVMATGFSLIVALGCLCAAAEGQVPEPPPSYLCQPAYQIDDI